MTEDDVPNARLEEGARAIQAVREEVRWKHGKDVQHLTKRQALGIFLKMRLSTMSTV